MVPTLVFDLTKVISNHDNLETLFAFYFQTYRQPCCVFVANPNKTPPIQEILVKNKDKLVEFLTSFHNDRTEDEQFNDEKIYLIKQIKEL